MIVFHRQTSIEQHAARTDRVNRDAAENDHLDNGGAHA
jgi:hypothetical protein